MASLTGRGPDTVDREVSMFLEEASLPPGLRVYAVGDVHGRADLLARMLDAIERDVAGAPVARHRIVMLGDYTDRGPQSREVVEMLAGRTDDPDFVCLRGNHDDWFETFLTHPDAVGDSFLRWGGIETLASYGVDVAGNGWRSEELSRELNRLLPASHRRFLSRLENCHVEGDYFFVHAGVRPGVPLDRQERHDLLWIRDEFHYYRGSFGKVVVHGHTPNDEIEVMANRINVDTRAWSSGVLSAVVLEGAGHRFIQVGRD